MGTDVSEQVELKDRNAFKVHSALCLELKKFVDRISDAYSDIESARPRCSSGIQALCSLHVAMEKANCLLVHCSESSKLYLSLTGERILLKCKNIGKALDFSLDQIQNMVPSLLAAKISGIIEDLRGAKFLLESKEEEAGKVLSALLRQNVTASDSIIESERQAVQLAAVRLQITSPVAIVIEKSSIKRQIEKARDTDPRKKKILRCLLYLLRKYGGSIEAEPCTATGEAWDKALAEDFGSLEPPLEFKCPISMRLMYDPVVIASGKTFERVWIERWISEGNETCPVTHMRLENLSLTPNVAVKSLISRWCSKYSITISDPSAKSVAASPSLQRTLSSTSIASFASSMNDLNLQVSSVSLKSVGADCDSDLVDEHNICGGVGLPQIQEDGCTSDTSRPDLSISLSSLSRLASLPWRSQCKVVQDIKEELKKNEQASKCMYPASYWRPSIEYLKRAHELRNIDAQKDIHDILLAILSSSRNEMLPFDEDAVYVLASFLDSATAGNALTIMEILSHHQSYKSGIAACGVLPSLLKVVDTQARDLCELALKILCNLSGNKDTAHHIVYLDCVANLVPFLGDPDLSGRCLSIMNNLCCIEEGRNALAEKRSCITSIAKLVANGNKQEQETALEILLTLCYEHAGICEQVMGESLIQFLLTMSVNVNSRRKVIASELLQLLGHDNDTEVTVSDSSSPSHGFSRDISSETVNVHKEEKKLGAFGFLARKILRFLRLRE